jgi:hypothetical protein
VPTAIRVAQAIMLFPLGLLVVFGGTYFGFIHQIEVMHVGEYAVAVWAIAQGLLAIFTAIMLGTGRQFYRTLATVLMCGHLLFGVVKLVVWQETAAIPFMVLDAVVLALLARASTGAAPPSDGDEAGDETHSSPVGSAVHFIAGIGFDAIDSKFSVPQTA